MHLFCFPPPPQFFLRPRLEIICCYIARYYVKNSTCAGGVKFISPQNWGRGGQNRIDPKVHADGQFETNLKGFYRVQKKFIIKEEQCGTEYSCQLLRSSSASCN